MSIDAASEGPDERMFAYCNSIVQRGLSRIANITVIQVGVTGVDLFATDSVSIPIEMPSISGLARPDGSSACGAS